MKVSTERIPQSQVVLQIEVEDERLAAALDSAYQRLAAKTRIPGFRPGKAPRAVVERHLGEHTLVHEAIDWLVPRVYQEALEREQIDPIDYPQLEVISEQPLVVKATVAVRPTVELGDYRSLRVPRDPVVVEPERVQEALETLRRRYATLEPIQRPIQWGDVLRADVHGEVDGAVIVHEEDAEFQLQEGRTVSLPGVAEQLIGLEKGAEQEFQVTVPEEVSDQRLRGRTASYRARIKEVKEEVLPELDDDFARQVGEGFPSLAALRARIGQDLHQSEEEAAAHRHHDRILEALADRAALDYPPVLVEREVDRLLREQMDAAQALTGNPRSGRPQRGGRLDASAREELERYLLRVGKSEEQVRQELAPLAETRVRRSLVLSRVAEAEDIQVSDTEIEAEIERLASGAGHQADEVRRLFSSDSAKESLRRSLLTRKTLERLVAIAGSDGAAPEPAVPAEQATEAPTTPAKGGARRPQRKRRSKQ